jgi:hypothetical protein
LSQAFAAEPTNVSITTGPQLKQRFEEAVNQQDTATAVRYFADRKYSPDIDHLAEVSFQIEKDNFDLFFIPFDQSAPDATAETVPLVLASRGPKGGKVLLGTISTKTKPEVKEENVVQEGKIAPGQGQLKRLVGCTVIGCLAAAGCVVGGPAAIPCFCLTCGGTIIGCGLNELFFQ